MSAKLDARFGDILAGDQPGWDATALEPYFRSLKQRAAGPKRPSAGSVGTVGSVGSVGSVAVLVSGAARTMTDRQTVEDYAAIFAHLRKQGLNITVFAYLSLAVPWRFA